MAPTKPAATPADAAQIVWEHYGLRVAACKDLPSYDDRNFMMDVAAQDDAGADAAGGDGLGTTPRVALNRYVLKITNTEDSADTSLLECHNSAMRFLAARGIRCNEPIANNCGEDMTFVRLPLGAGGAAAAAGGVEGAASGAAAAAVAAARAAAGAATAFENTALQQQQQQGGRRLHVARLLTYVEGGLLRDSAPLSPSLRQGVGAFFGRLSVALQAFDHPAAHREGFEWGMAGAGAVIRKYARHTAEEGGKRAALLEVAHRYEEQVAPLAPRLRTACIHGDGNEMNVLVCSSGSNIPDITSVASPATGATPALPAAAAAAAGAATVPPNSNQAATEGGAPQFGLLDFGDFHVSFQVAECAIVAAYVALLAVPPATHDGCSDDLGAGCLDAAADVAAGYDSARPLTEDEWAALPALVLSRIAQSLAIGAYSAAETPGNAEYVLTTQRPGWAALLALLRADEGAVRRRFRAGLGGGGG